MTEKENKYPEISPTRQPWREVGARGVVGDQSDHSLPPFLTDSKQHTFPVSLPISWRYLERLEYCVHDGETQDALARVTECLQQAYREMLLSHFSRFVHEDTQPPNCFNHRMWKLLHLAKGSFQFC